MYICTHIYIYIHGMPKHSNKLHSLCLGKSEQSNIGKGHGTGCEAQSSVPQWQVLSSFSLAPNARPDYQIWLTMSSPSHWTLWKTNIWCFDIETECLKRPTCPNCQSLPRLPLQVVRWESFEHNDPLDSQAGLGKSLLVGSDRWKLSNPTGASGEPLFYIFNCVLKSFSVLCEYQACALLEEPSLQMAALEDLADLRWFESGSAECRCFQCKNVYKLGRTLFHIFSHCFAVLSGQLLCFGRRGIFVFSKFSNVLAVF